MSDSRRLLGWKYSYGYENWGAFVFDVCSFYGHNEYDIGNQKAPRHRLRNAAYVNSYQECFAVSEPEDWDARNLLYSLTLNISNAIYVPGSTQRQVQVIYNNMVTLCRIFCPEKLELLNKPSKDNTNPFTNIKDKSLGQDAVEEGV